MTYVRLEPLKGFEKLSKKFNEFASDFEKGISFEMGGFNPRVDIIEDENALYFEAEIPGIKKEDVKVSVNDENILTIKGEKKHELKEEAKLCCNHERSYGEFSRSFMIPKNFDSEKISANYENGVLTLTVPKMEPAKPKEYNVEIS